MRWEEQRDADHPPLPRRWATAAALAGLGIALVTGTALYPQRPTPSPIGPTAAAEAVEEPTGRGGLPHTVPSPWPSTTAAATVEAPPVAEVAATVPVAVPAAPPPVGRVGQPCDVPGTTAVTADGAPVTCAGGKGNGVPRWRKA